METELLYLQSLQIPFMPARYLIGVKVDQAARRRQCIYNTLGIFHNPVTALILWYGLYNPFAVSGIYHPFMNPNKAAGHILRRQGAYFRPAKRSKGGQAGGPEHIRIMPHCIILLCMAGAAGSGDDKMLEKL